MNAFRIVVPVLAAALTFSSLSTPAAARPVTDREARDGDHFPSSIDTTVPPGGTSTLTSPTVPKNATKATIKIQSTGSDADSFKQMEAWLATSKTKGQKLMKCITLHQLVTTQRSADYGAVSYRSDNEVLALLMLSACLEIAQLIDSTAPAAATPAARAAAATSGCKRTGAFAAPFTVKKRSSGYRLKVEGETTKPKGFALRIGCRTDGDSMTLSLRTTKKGAPLRSVIGKQLRFGLYSPSEAESSSPVTVTFNVK